MKESFWINKPLDVKQLSGNLNPILPVNILLEKINNEISKSKLQLDYSVYELPQLDDTHLEQIIAFINNNYVTSDSGDIILMYSRDLFKFCMRDAILIEFYPKDKNNVIGYILGKKCPMSLYKNIFDSCAVDFLCILPKLRNMGVSSYMINVLTKELILHYSSVIAAHYTISAPIKSPSFGMKKFYHRIINVSNLCKARFFGENVNQQGVTDLYTKFLYKYQFKKKHTVKYLNNNIIDAQLIKELYDKYISYADKAYDIYEKVSLEEFTSSFNNPAFHHFIVYKRSTIESYVCFFQLDSYNVKEECSYRSGFYYYMFFNDIDNLINSLEYINEYIYQNNIFDLITFSDIFQIDYKKINCIPGTGFFRYYIYNVTCPPIENSRNGLITI